MPHQTLVISNDEHAEIIAAVMGQNGLNASRVGLYHEGKHIAYDEVRVDIDDRPLKVRATPEDDLTSMFRKRYERYLLEGFELSEEEVPS